MGKLGLSAQPYLFSCFHHRVSGQYALPLALHRIKKKLGERINTTAAHLSVVTLGHKINGNGHGYVSLPLKRRSQGVRMYRNQRLGWLDTRSMDAIMGSMAVVHVDVPGKSSADIVGGLSDALDARMDDGGDIHETLGVDPSTTYVACLVLPPPSSGMYVLSMGLFDSKELGSDVHMSKGLSDLVDGSVMTFHKSVQDAFPVWADELGEWIALKGDEATAHARSKRR